MSLDATRAVLSEERAKQKTREIIKVENLTKDYGSGRGIFDVSLRVAKGETLGFLGPNGAGKTTTIRQLVGFQEPQKGSTRILELDCFKDRCKIMESVGYLPGEVNFPQGLKAKDVLDVVKTIKGMKDKGREEELLKLFPIDLKNSTKKMSVGEKRKLAIIVAFISDPDILILDEPSSGLDPNMQRVFIDFILEEKRRGKTILLSSHMFDEVGALCDRIVIIKDGRIIHELLASEIKRPEEKVYEIGFADKISLAKFEKKHSLTQKSDRRDSIKITVKDADINGFLAELSDYKIANLAEQKFDLETFFLNFYKPTSENTEKISISAIVKEAKENLEKEKFPYWSHGAIVSKYISDKYNIKTENPNEVVQRWKK